MLSISNNHSLGLRLGYVGNVWWNSTYTVLCVKTKRQKFACFASLFILFIALFVVGSQLGRYWRYVPLLAIITCSQYILKTNMHCVLRLRCNRTLAIIAIASFFSVRPAVRLSKPISLSRSEVALSDCRSLVIVKGFGYSHNFLSKVWNCCGTIRGFFCDKRFFVLHWQFRSGRSFPHCFELVYRKRYFRPQAICL